MWNEHPENFFFRDPPNLLFFEKKSFFVGGKSGCILTKSARISRQKELFCTKIYETQTKLQEQSLGTKGLLLEKVFHLDISMTCLGLYDEKKVLSSKQDFFQLLNILTDGPKLTQKTFLPFLRVKSSSANF